jgi:hypothetical protein
VNALGGSSEFSLCVPAVNDADDDNDGYTDVVESGALLCLGNGNEDGPPVVNDDALVNDGCPAVGPPESMPQCANNLDDDGDAAVNDGCAQANAFSEAQFKIGTSSSDPCGTDGWPSNPFDGGLSANKTDIQDIVSFIAPQRRLDKSPPNPLFNMRWDLEPGPNSVFTNFISIFDLTTMLSGGLASPAYPPMFNGFRAFGRTCPFPP